METPDFTFVVDHPIRRICEDGEQGVARNTREIASRIAEIHLLAMDSNPLLHAQFPTAESLANLCRFLVDSYEAVLASEYTSLLAQDLGSTADELGDGGILVARKSALSQQAPGGAELGEIVGFATWEYSPGAEAAPSHHGSDSRDENANSAHKLETEISNHVEGCRKEYLYTYARLSTEAKETCFGGQECYQISFVCTDPRYQGKGVGSALTRKVLELAQQGPRLSGRRTKLPVYLESTLLAVPMYERLGFKALGSFEMKITSSSKSSPSKLPQSRVGESSSTKDGGIHIDPTLPDVSLSTDSTDERSSMITYKEICMVWHP
ncbi:hypothetical protein V8F06_000624 [Rhypophila decipiens]